MALGLSCSRRARAGEGRKGRGRKRPPRFLLYPERPHPGRSTTSPLPLAFPQSSVFPAQLQAELLPRVGAACGWETGLGPHRGRLERAAGMGLPWGRAGQRRQPPLPAPVLMDGLLLPRGEGGPVRGITAPGCCLGVGCFPKDGPLAGEAPPQPSGPVAPTTPLLPL